MMEKQVPHNCDCPYCMIESETVEVKEGPITESTHRMNETMRAIYEPLITQQLKEGVEFMRILKDT